MPSFHLSVKAVSRSAGRCATAAAAYRAGVEILDERTGVRHDYRRKGGVESSAIVLPTDVPDWATDRVALWNAAEQSETRKNSTVAREFEIALPAELSAEARTRLAHDFARELVERHRCAADVAIHAPGREGDQRNHHAHILLTTRRLTVDGFGEKTRELDDQKSGEVVRWRARFAELQNERLEQAGMAERVDHRSLAEQGEDREPTRHLGPAASAIVRRGGTSWKQRQFQREASERLVQARTAGEIERERQRVEQSILSLEADLAAALKERDQMQEQARMQRVIDGGRADFRAGYEAYKAEKARQEMAADEQRRRALEALEQVRAAQREREGRRIESGGRSRAGEQDGERERDSQTRKPPGRGLRGPSR